MATLDDKIAELEKNIRDDRASLEIAKRNENENRENILHRSISTARETLNFYLQQQQQQQREQQQREQQQEREQQQREREQQQREEKEQRLVMVRLVTAATEALNRREQQEREQQEREQRERERRQPTRFVGKTRGTSFFPSFFHLFLY